METFSQLLNKVALEGRVAYLPLCAKLKVTHLSFADDLMVFTSAQVHSLQGIRCASRILHMSRLKVSTKSEIFCCNVADHQSLAAIMNLKLG